MLTHRNSRGGRPSPRTLAIIGAGGFFGTLLRSGVGEISGTTGAATLAVNLTGAALLGFLLGWAPWRGRSDPGASAAQGFFGTGLLGGFTTYSALAREMITAPLVQGITYGAITVIAGVALATAGVLLGGRLRPAPGGER